MFVAKLKSAIHEEYKAYFLYRSLYDTVEKPMWKDFIRHMYEDEKSHYEMFQQLHYMLTGSYVANPKRPAPCYDVKACVQQALLDELEAVETYKEMLLSIPIQDAYNPLFIAMQDEMEHAIRLSVIYNGLQ
ncbi:MULTISPECIES: ferritin family protein [Sporosarcina]|uniref:ferritin family protein n=1 Tax=Sporosarcina TaxID=1569 RepID=UPI00058B2B6E|nr:MULTISPECIES: ferritin-like domain-containing protein [Sporosarcina]WJY27688.1 ferritin-like domain-containing protein [Sporosarcina sp. 0.2-SM1T-5]